MLRRLFSLPILPAVVLSVFLPATADALTPDLELWNSFMDRPLPATAIPEDSSLGPLADLRRPDAAWGSSIAACESVFSILVEGRIPEELFSPDLAVPLRLAFEAAMAGEAVFSASRRYGLPERTGSRLVVPVRLAGEDALVYGHIYLVRRDSAWLVEQWAVNITPFMEAGG